VSTTYSTTELLSLLTDDQALAYLELEKDIVFPHLSTPARLQYINHALRAGRGQAALYKGMDVFHLANALGVRLVAESTQSVVAGVIFRSTYDFATRTITIYKSSIDQVYEVLSELLPKPWDGEQVLSLHIAHELFHHLEATHITPVHEQLPPVSTFRLGPIHVTRACSRQCGEIAAHAFARELLDLPFLPSAIDWLVLVAQQQWPLSELQAALHRAENEVATAIRALNKPELL
jgi:hypothetical protein